MREETRRLYSRHCHRERRGASLRNQAQGRRLLRCLRPGLPWRGRLIPWTRQRLRVELQPPALPTCRRWARRRWSAERLRDIAQAGGISSPMLRAMSSRERTLFPGLYSFRVDCRISVPQITQRLRLWTYRSSPAYTETSWTGRPCLCDIETYGCPLARVMRKGASAAAHRAAAGRVQP